MGAIDLFHIVLVVDTNILAYLLIVGDRTQEAQALFAQDAQWKSEAFILVEFSNILATYQRLGELGGAQADYLLNEAEMLLYGLVNLPHIVALKAAQKFKVSAYDARFLATAETLNARLMTEDTKLRKAAPALTQSLAEALAGG